MKNKTETKQMPWENDTGTDPAETISAAVEEKQEFKLRIPDKLTKDNFNEVANVLFHYIDCNADPLKAYIKLKAYLEVLTLIQNKLKDSAINEANKHQKGERTILGVKFEVTAGTVGIGTAPGVNKITSISSATGSAAGLFLRSAASATVAVLIATQLHATGAQPALELNQIDISEGFIDFVGDAGVSIAESTNSTDSVIVEVNGNKRRLALYPV